MFRCIGIDADTIVDDIQVGPIHIQAQATLREIQRLAEAAQRHWLIRGYVEDDAANTRIAPQEVIVIP